MIKRKTMGLIAAAGLVAAPVAATAAAERASAPVSAENPLGGEGALAFVALGILAAFIAITVVTNSEDEPASP